MIIDRSSLPLYQVEPISGALSQVETVPQRASFTISTPDPQQVIQAVEQHHQQVTSFFNQHGKIFQGGNAATLHQLLHIPSGDRLLYVGDHIFADILRSKKSLGWRTCLIVPELSHEIDMMKTHYDEGQALFALRKQQYVLENAIDGYYLQQNALKYELTTSFTPSSSSGASGPSSTIVMGSSDRMLQIRQEIMNIEETLQSIELRLLELRNLIRHKLSQYDQHFHHRWGQVSVAHICNVINTYLKLTHLFCHDYVLCAVV